MMAFIIHHCVIMHKPIQVTMTQNEITSAKTAQTITEKRQSLVYDQYVLLTFKIKTAAKRRYSTRSPRSHSSAFFT